MCSTERRRGGGRPSIAELGWQSLRTNGESRRARAPLLARGEAVFLSSAGQRGQHPRGSGYPHPPSHGDPATKDYRPRAGSRVQSTSTIPRLFSPVSSYGKLHDLLVRNHATKPQPRSCSRAGSRSLWLFGGLTCFFGSLLWIFMYDL
jgi:hypothetical protein